MHIEWLADLDAFTANDIFAIVGDSAGRHFRVDMDKVEFSPPTVTIPDSGSIPFTAEGTALASTATSRDEVLVSYL